MDVFSLSSPSNSIDSLDWTESEGRSQNSMTIVGDSQFPLRLPVCPDSQDTGVRCGRPGHLFCVSCFKSTETAESLDMERWDLADGELKSQKSGSQLGHGQPVLCPPPSLDTQEFEARYMRSDDLSPEKGLESLEISSLREMACWSLAAGEAISQDAVRPLVESETPACPPTDGEVKSQKSGSRLGHAPPVLCPPPSLDTQEFEARYMRSDDLSPEKGLESLEISSLHEMACWNLAAGEAISQDAVRPLVEAEAPPCPPASLDSQEFLRRCGEEEHFVSIVSEENSERSPPKAPEVSDLGDDETGPKNPLKAVVEENTLSCPLSPIDMQDVELKLTRGEDVLSVHSLQLSNVAPGEEVTQGPVGKLHFHPKTQPPLDCFLISQEFASQLDEKENVSVVISLDFALDESCRRSPYLHSSRSQSPRSAAYNQNSRAHRSNPTSSLDAPLTNPTPDTVGKVNGHRSKRKNQDLCLSIDSPECRSPLRSLPVNSRHINDVKYEGNSNARQRCEVKVLISEAEVFENMAHVEVPEPSPSGQECPTGKENVEFQKIQKGVGATVSTTSTTWTEPKFDAGDERVSANHPKNPFQASKQVHVLPKSIKQLDTNTLDRKSPLSVQTQLSSRVGFTSYPATTKRLVSEDHDISQGWLCPRASKKLLLKKPRQRFIDTWLK